MRKILLVIIVNTYLFISFSYSQNKSVITLTNNYPEGTIIAEILENDRIIETYVTGPEIEKKVIIEFTEPPICIAGKRSMVRKSTKSEIFRLEAQHKRFKEDLELISRKIQIGQIRKSGIPEIHRSFQYAINGVAFISKQNVIDEIAKLSYVKNIFEDKVTRIIDDESNQVINANKIWDDYGITGRNIIIGIIDTGIDSTHNELDGGKVIGGYDFVNDDNDPMDDHGHGTHCAAIAAANGDNLKGVAPDAKLMGIKVLDSSGSGFTSDIIAGIEYALDPDGNPETDDGVDVISMSLGGAGDPNDASSIAVNNAFKNGVLCIVAAGNDGSNNYTIGSPGCAKDALTVGASDNTDNLADFSSRGPTNQTYDIKPDIVAPGVGIYSATPNNNYESWNGTSMATPHVAGAAALLLEMNQNWTPDIVKSALVQSSKDLGYKIWEQGNGRLDVYKAASLNTIIKPTNINFGIVNENIGLWEKSDTLILVNLSSYSKNYSLEIETNSNSGVYFNVEPANITIPANGISRIVVGVSVNNLISQYPTDNIPAFIGKLFAKSNQDTIIVPLSTIKSKLLNIKFDFNPFVVIIHNKQEIVYSTHYPGNEINCLLKEGKYDIIVNDNNSYYVKESIDPEETKTLNIYQKDFKNEVIFQGVDPFGNKVPALDASCELFLNKESEIGIKLIKFVISFGTPPPVQKNFSDLTENYKYEIAPIAYPSWTDKYNWYYFPFLIDKGLNSSATLTINPNDYKKVVFKYRNFNSTDSLFYTNGTMSYTLGWGYSDFDATNIGANILKPMHERKAYYLPKPSLDYKINNRYNNRIFLYKNGLDVNTDKAIHQTSWIEFPYNSDYIIFSKYGYTTSLELSAKCNKPFTEIPIRLSPPHWDDVLYLSEKQISFKEESNMFLNVYNDFTFADIQYRLYKDNLLITQGKIYNSIVESNSNYIGIDYTNDTYCLEFEFNDYYVFEKKGIASARFKIIDNDLRSITFFKSLKILSNNIPSDIIDVSASNAIEFKFYDEIDTSKIAVNYRELNNPNWNTLKIDSIAENYHVRLPQNLNSGYYSIHISCINYNHDTLEYILEPAFYASNKRQLDSLALVELYYATNGDSWKNKDNWLTENSIDTWYGVKVIDKNIKSIELNNNNLSGRIPESVTKISSLSKLDISNNFINDLADFNNIDTMLLSNNNFTFEDLEENMDNKYINYYPQNESDSIYNQYIEVGSQLKILIYIGGSKNDFTWYKDDIVQPNADSTIFYIDSTQFNDSGKYYCLITNDLVPGLTIASKIYNIEIMPKIFCEVKNSIISADNKITFGGAWIDFDNDNDQDLYTVNYGSPNKLYENISEGDSTYFVDITENSIGFDYSRSRNSTWGDFNNDDYLDVFVCNNTPFEFNQLYINQGNKTFNKITEGEIVNNPLSNSLSSSTLDYNKDGFLDIFINNGWYYEYDTPQNELFINNQDGTFYNYPINNNSFSNYGNWIDIDNDNDLDRFEIWASFESIYSNDNNSFLNNLLNSDFSIYSTAGSWGDYDNDGDMDLFITTNYDKPNKLYVNDGNGNFTHLKGSELTNSKVTSIGSCWGDIDNDGDLDLFVTNNSCPNELWKNKLMETGIPEFELINYGEIGNIIGGSSGTSFADYDNDGDLDLFISTGTNNRLFKNLSENNNWINIHCIGNKSNKSAIGTKVRIKAMINEKSQWQYREIYSQTGYSSQDSYNVEFGLGNSDIIDSLVIIWPSGIVWDTTNVMVNQFLTIKEQRKPNVAPIITGQREIVIIENESYNISFEDIQVEDPDNSYPADFILHINNGLNYQLNNKEIIPDKDFSGLLNIPIYVSDGIDQSNLFLLQIRIDRANNTDGIFKNGQLSIYPNPFKDYIILELDNSDLKPFISLKNILSEDITQKVKFFYYGNKIEIFTGELKKGLYIINITTKNSNISELIYKD